MINVRPGTKPLFSFRATGIPIHVHISFLVVSVLLGWQGGDPLKITRWAVIVFVSVVAHELGHALAARACGLRPEIDLHGWGGLTIIPGGGSLSRAQSLAVTLAGPGVSIVIGLCAAAAVHVGEIDTKYGTDLLSTAMADVIHVNLIWGLANLLPIMPLDGGSAFRTAIDKLPKLDADLVSAVVSILIAGGALGFALVTARPWIGILSGTLLYSNYLALRGRFDEKRDEAMKRELGGALDKAQETRDAASLIDTARKAIAAARSPGGRAYAAEVLAIAQCIEGRPEDALKTLASYPQGFTPGLATEVYVLSQAGYLARAIERIHEVHAVSPSDTTRSLLEQVSKAAAERADIDLGTRIKALRQARDYSRAIDLVAGDDPELIRMREHLEREKAAWDGATAVLDDPGRLQIDGPLFGLVIEAGQRLGRDADVARAGAELMDRAPDPDLAFQVARAWERAGDPSRADEWHTRAFDAGFRGPPPPEEAGEGNKSAAGGVPLK